MSHISSRNTESYKEALKATESIEPPSLGFLKSSDFPGTLSHQVAVIKQHNVQIQLLVQIAEDIRGIRAELQTLRELQQSKAVQSQVVPDELITKLTNLNLGPSERPKENFIVLKSIVLNLDIILSFNVFEFDVHAASSYIIHEGHPPDSGRFILR